MEHMVGMFVNTLAMRNRQHGAMTFKDFLANVQENTLAAFDNQLYQYEDLIEALDLPRNAGHNPLFDVFFSYNKQTQTGEHLTDAEIQITTHEIPYKIAKFDLNLAVEDSKEIRLWFTYRTDLFEASSIARFS